MQGHGCGCGDIYGQSRGPSTISDTYPVVLRHAEGMFGDGPVTGSVNGALQLGQFTFAQATVGLLLLLGLIWYADKRL